METSESINSVAGCLKKRKKEDGDNEELELLANEASVLNPIDAMNATTSEHELKKLRVELHQARQAALENLLWGAIYRIMVIGCCLSSELDKIKRTALDLTDKIQTMRIAVALDVLRSVPSNIPIAEQLKRLEELQLNYYSDDQIAEIIRVLIQSRKKMLSEVSTTPSPQPSTSPP